MPTGREHFALDWIKGELLETLSEAREALEGYAESDGDLTRMRTCLTGMHQVHGTLVMLELEGMGLLADHLERLAQEMLNETVADQAAASQCLMQGILELPGYFEEVQQGLADTTEPMLPLVNEVRRLLGEKPLSGGAVTELGPVDAAAIERFEGIDGDDKAKRIRAAYQQVLLSILKGGDRRRAVVTLTKVSQGLCRVCAGTPHESLWRAFGEFVASLGASDGPLDGDAVKLLRRVDAEIRQLASDGATALKAPISLELVRQLVDSCRQRNYSSEVVEELRALLDGASQSDGLSISGRQALASAAGALREELALVKDQLDLFVRSGDQVGEELSNLLAPLKQIGSTLSLLGFESSKTIVSDQVDTLNRVVDEGSLAPQTVMSVASALVQVDENLASFTQGKAEAEQITDDAQRAVLVEARAGLEQVKQGIVDYISSQWDARQLDSIPGQVASICGALDMIPLPRAGRLLSDCGAYLTEKLIPGGQPEWQDMDALADAISGVDYYLERLAEESSVGAEDILELVARSLLALGYGERPAEAVPMVDMEAPSLVTPEGEPPEDALPDPELTRDAPGQALEDSKSPQATDETLLSLGTPDEEIVEVGTTEESEEPRLEMDNDSSFDLSNPMFDALAEEHGQGRSAAQNEPPPPPQSLEPLPDVEADEPPAVDEMSGVGETPATDDLPVADESEVVAGDVETTPADSQTRPLAEHIAAKTATLADVFESDEEIVEIFVEEVGEVLEAIGEHLPQWADDFGREGALAEVRRAFHTLKGSGRIVGANVIGEVAWSVENMLNRVIEGTVEPSAELVGVVDDARVLVVELRGAFEIEQAPDLEKVGRLMERADILASGGTLEDQAQTAQPPPIDVDLHDSDVAADPAELFLSEAAEHLQVLRHALDEQEFTINEASLRALHTLAGSAGMSGVDAIGELARPTYELARVLHVGGDETVVEGEAGIFFNAAVGALADGLRALETGQEAEEQMQLIADADLLLMQATKKEPAGDALLSLSALDVVSDAETFYENWREGAVDLEFSGRLVASLVELAQAAQTTNRPAVADLARAQAAAIEHFEHDALAASTHAVFAKAHEHLLAQLDAIAADQTVMPAEDDVAALSALVSMPSDSEAMELDAQTEPAATAARAGGDEAESEIALVTPSDAALEQIAARAEAGFDLSDAQDDEPLIEEAEDDAEIEHEVIEHAHAGADSREVTPPRHNVVEFPSEAEAEAEADADAVADAGAEAGASAEVEIDLEQVAALDDAQSDLEPVDEEAPSLILEDIDEEIIGVFFEEADEILEVLEQSIHEWSQEADNRLYLENLLRGLHTLKGGARLSGLSQLGDLTHQFESFLIDVQGDDATPDGGFFDDLSIRYDELAGLVGEIHQAVESGVAMPAEDDLGDTARADAEQEPESASQPDREPVPLLDNEPAQNTRAPSASAPVEEPAAAPDAMAPESAATADARNDAGPVPSAEPSAEPSPEPSAEPSPEPSAEPSPESQRAPEPETSTPEEVAAKVDRGKEMVRVGAGLLEQLVNLAGESSIVRARVEQGMNDFTSALDEMETTIERVREQLRRLEIETEAQILFRRDNLDGPSYEDFDPLEMDRYSQLQQLSRGLSESASDMLDLKDTLLFKARESETLLLQQARINTELQEGLMRTRMVPFSRLLPRLRRIVRQVSRELGKDVDFKAYNVDGELDRNLLERMVPPLEHMLRNAVDHGIESAERRRSYGKPETGRINLRLSREGGDVVIEISDDGAGIDVETVRAKAVERGLIADGATLSDEEISQFVLAPGFSTAKSVTQISGRGVGMDVVHSEVKQLGGSISILSRAGKGTRFSVRVPFTVSVNRALMVSVGEDLYAIPLNNIEGIVLLSPQELETLYAPNGNTFEYAGIPYRVRYLGHYLGREFRAAAQQGSVPVVLVRAGDQSVAVHVDAVQGSREIVVKSLGPQFAGVGGVSGATILGDGSVVVILDLLALIRAQRGEGLGAGRRSLASASRTRCVMVVDDSVTVRKVTSRLLERQGMDVLVAKDGIEAVALLQERRPDVMLLDIEMPRMDGFEVARQVRHDDRLNDLPIIMISSRTGEKHQEHAAELGVNGFLGKPFQENELLATIDELVN